MFKKTVLSTLLLVSSITLARVKIDFDLSINENPIVDTIIGDVVTELGSLATFNHGNVAMDVTVDQADENNVVVKTTIYEKNEDKATIIAEPILLTEMNQPATITLSKKSNNDLGEEQTEQQLSLTVVVSNVE